jgi:2-keto-myo-inositol isomerase
MTPCISQVTTLPASFADDLVHAAEAGFASIEIWLTKFEQHLKSASAADTAKLIADSGLSLAAASYQGGLLVAADEQRTIHFDHFKNRLDLCQRFGIPVMVLSADLSSSVDGLSLGRAMKSLTEAARWAAGFGVRLALEFRGGDAFCSCLDTAITLVEQCAEPNLGICLDAFHYYKGPSKPEDLERITAKNLAHVQVCDVEGIPRELMTDADRVLPGDGSFRIAPIVARLREIRYAGAVSLELMNPMLWQGSARQLVGLGKQALDRLLE